MSPTLFVLFGEDTLPTTNQETSWIMVGMAAVTMVGGIFTGLFGLLSNWLKSKNDLQIALLTQEIKVMQDKLEESIKDRAEMKIRYEQSMAIIANDLNEFKELHKESDRQMSIVKKELKDCEEKHQKSQEDYMMNASKIDRLFDSVEILKKNL